MFICHRAGMRFWRLTTALLWASSHVIGLVGIICNGAGSRRFW